MINKQLLLTLVSASIVLAGCSSAPSKRYSIDDDIAPDAPISVDHIEDATPQYESYSLGGNSDYTLRGNRYTIIKDPQGFKEEGIASWYGKKFHGHLTSNGEVYDMYSMSAAHKELPIPSYVKVTNKDNGKTAIVRVNDRGPFHPGRIIDLSYAAATKLDVIKTGTANVAIEVITVDKPTQTHKQEALSKFAVQVASSQHQDRVETLAQDLSQKLSVKSYVNSTNDTHRVFLGPFDDYMSSQKALERVKELGYTSAFIKSH
ncbi:septal ring lytic transglycosylase RlpA family protein [Vibrio brasiliensis]|jgi:rare lipoprotein A|uniref:Endolytic peptidoglycan transglycosylase RlpA n=1 Tax=Vibrio brasiliensis LMG 20546 TaxID=945543 RepID=E8M0N9_9VIBR|nr:septal ring lytic transglycosylase RlpA family protein [Vibrio brasiliensis]EGA63564.1 putative rare lipoprotein A [Vibrio brasiliensis LMG 20546]MCG9649897.1 septal ring lytic transglycosylase RlpA family protein [Vibrio brasiliensis]MCG9726059.1 septal ring lytic transglycosylase RlpA family protein [Vibrio brasiliensis]